MRVEIDGRLNEYGLFFSIFVGLPHSTRAENNRVGIDIVDLENAAYATASTETCRGVMGTLFTKCSVVEGLLVGHQKIRQSHKQQAFGYGVAEENPSRALLLLWYR